MIEDSPSASLPDGPRRVETAASAAAAVTASAALRWLWLALAVLGALCMTSVVLAWKAEQRGAVLEQELVRRQQDSAGKVLQAYALAKQAQESTGDTAAKVALLEARVAEVSVQRSQLEDLIQSLSRSRDENLLADVEAAIRVAMQQTAITGSAEPLVATLKQSDDRLANYNQPRLEGVRRAITRDLDRVKATSVSDIGALGIKLDEASRLVDDLPLLSVADAITPGDAVRPAVHDQAAGPALPASGANASPAWVSQLTRSWKALNGAFWDEVRSLVRVTRIDRPEAMLLAPEQSFFVRENLKLRLLNARLALLSRQFDTAQSDLQAVQAALDRYFDRHSKRTQLAVQLIRQVAGQARQVVVPRPDDTLAALAAASTVR